MTGYAFHLGVASGLCPSGPTAFQWGTLLPGVNRLGRSTAVYQAECFAGPKESEASRESFRAALAFAQREVEAGRPCVLWGAYVPEFAAVVGIRGDSYLVKSYRECNGEPQPPIPYDELNAPGGPYVLAFPTPTEFPRAETDRRALGQAVAMFRNPACSPRYRYGTAGYDRWIEELEARRADAGGNSYAAACYAEGRRFAREFLQRVAERTPAIAAPLRQAAGEYGAAAQAMDRVAALFPFPGQWGAMVDDGAAIAEATDALRTARDAETRAIERVAALMEQDRAGG
jgi:hypothetical protein